MSDDFFPKGYESVEAAWKKINDNYALVNPPDFITHFNYVEYLSTLSNKISVDFKPSLKTKIVKSNNLEKKITLIKLTLENIKQEYETILKTPEFAVVCVSWISVKSYYLIFNLSMILRYLITCEEKSFNCTHTQLLHEFNEYFARGELSFSKRKFSTIYNGKVAHDWTAPVSNNVRTNYDPEILYLQIIKKLQEYKEDDYKYKNNILSIRKKKDKEKVMYFRENSKVSIFEFFYWYRIKASYRDLEFLDKAISSKKFADYYINYYKLTLNIHDALKNLINTLSLIRFEKALLT